MKIRHNGLRENIQESLKAPLTEPSHLPLAVDGDEFALAAAGADLLTAGLTLRCLTEEPHTAGRVRSSGRQGCRDQEELERALANLSGLPSIPSFHQRPPETLMLRRRAPTTSVRPRGWNCWFLTPLRDENLRFVLLSSRIEQREPWVVSIYYDLVVL